MAIQTVVLSYSTSLHNSTSVCMRTPSQMIIFGQDHFSYSHFYSYETNLWIEICEGTYVFHDSTKPNEC